MRTPTAQTKNVVSCKLRYKKIAGEINPAAINEVFGGLEGVSILGGNIAKKDADRFSYWAAEPVEIFEFRTGADDPFGKLEDVLNKYRLEENCESSLPKGVFCGGWIGYFSYELGRYIEKLPETTVDDILMPLIRLGFYDKVLCYDHIERCCWLIALEIDGDGKTATEKIEFLEKQLAKSNEVSIEQPGAADLSAIDLKEFRCNMDCDHYLDAIKKIKRYIYDGDVYQINFSQRFECDFTGRSLELFHWQNFHNPSGYAAYIDAGDFQVVSASPEMFITVADGVISTKPIKGTRRRTGDRAIDDKNYIELVECEKEQAELNMIIDLERNDLARICRPGSRSVVKGRTIEEYPTVFHAAATVAGKLCEGVGFCDILRAMFPGGSITGAPKVSAMEIIDETEPTARAVYTGSIGFIGLDGNVCLNIAIRTIIIKGQKAYAQTGGGIVADSKPKAEWQETITKARALLAGIKAVNKGKIKG